MFLWYDWFEGMTMDNKIGEKIALARKEKGLTQKELGDRLFVTDNAVSKS